MAFALCLCGFLSRLLQGWNWARSLWLSLVCTVWSFHQARSIFTYAFTLTSMYFLYVLIILSLTVLHINVQLFKKTTVAWYSSVTVDPVLLLLICMMYVSVVGTNIESMLEYTYLSVMVVLGLLFMTAFIPMIYIMFLMLYWIYSQRRWGLKLLKNVVILKRPRK